MKLTLHKKTKRILIIPIIAVVIFLFFQIYGTATEKKIVKEDKSIFEYSCKSEVDYKYYLKANELYPMDFIDEGKFYSKPLLDHIRTDFKIEYGCRPEANIQVKYKIVALVTGFQGQGEKKEIYWSKEFPLTEEKITSMTGDSFAAEEVIDFTLADYDGFALKAKEISAMKVSNEVEVRLDGNILINYEDYEEEIPISASVRVPLLEEVFKIEKEMGQEVRANIKEKEEIVVAPDKVKLSLLFAFSLLLIICLLLIIFVIKEPGQLTMLKNKNKAILKNYGSRMAAMEEIPQVTGGKGYRVTDMKDMIKISDEIQKPILYIWDDEILIRNNEVFIIDDDSTYRFSW